MASLATIDQIKEFMGATGDADDVRLTSLAARATAIIEQYCGRTFASTAYTGEMYDGSGNDTLILRNFPIIGTPTVLEYGTALVVGTDPAASPTPQVLVVAESGKLIRLFYHWIPYRNWYKITYTAGYATVPPEIAQACIDLVVIMAKEKERAGLAQHTTGAMTSTYVRDLPKASQWALDLHADIVLGRAC